jgi:hypothetical protein
MNADDLKPFSISVETINKYVKSTRVRAGRSINGLSLPAFTSKKDRAEVESKLKECFKGLQSDEELKGAYTDLTTMDKAMADELPATATYSRNLLDLHSLQLQALAETGLTIAASTVLTVASSSSG